MKTDRKKTGLKARQAASKELQRLLASKAFRVDAKAHPILALLAKNPWVGKKLPAWDRGELYGRG